jgi:hypothetical protein
LRVPGQPGLHSKILSEKEEREVKGEEGRKGKERAVTIAQW